MFYGFLNSWATFLSASRQQRAAEGTDEDVSTSFIILTLKRRRWQLTMARASQTDEFKLFTRKTDKLATEAAASMLIWRETFKDF